MLSKPGQKCQEGYTVGLMKGHYIGGSHSGRHLCSPLSHCILGQCTAMVTLGSWRILRNTLGKQLLLPWHH